MSRNFTIRKSLYDACAEAGKPELLAQWDTEKNDGKTPKEISYGSNKKLYWRCPEGHGFAATAKEILRRTHPCPYCGGRKVLPGFNDLATRRPELAAQWHPMLNGALTPQSVTAGSSRRVWWICEKGHVWNARVDGRTRGKGCPVCAGSRSAEAQPESACGSEERPAAGTSLRDYCVENGRLELLAQWDAEKNGVRTPENTSYGSCAKAFWRCERGHSYEAAPFARTCRGADCPYCRGRKVLPGFNDLATKRPEIAEQWHPTLNGELTPQSVTAGSSRNAWWLCAKGHIWETRIDTRTSQGSGCPVCAGNVNRRRLAYYQTVGQNRKNQGAEQNEQYQRMEYGAETESEDTAVDPE